MTARRSLCVTIEARRGDVWPLYVEVASEDALPITVTAEMTLDLAELTSRVDPRAYGEYLGDAIFRGPVRDAFMRASEAPPAPLHVLLSLDARELRPLQWEHLCAPFAGGPELLAMHPRVAYSRFIPSTIGAPFQPLAPGAARALVVVAAPRGLEKYELEPFDAAAAIRAAREAMRPVPVDVLGPDPECMGPATLDRLVEALLRTRYSHLHLVAHGRIIGDPPRAVVYLCDDDGGVGPVAQDQLVARLRAVDVALPSLVFLATCDSAAEHGDASMGSLARHLVGELGIPAVVAMSRRVAVATAHLVARAFYVGLHAHGHVDQALTEAAAVLAGHPDILVPALYSRLGARPLLAVPPPTTSATATTATPATPAITSPIPLSPLPDGLQPEYPSEQVRELAIKLRDAYTQARRLEAAGLPAPFQLDQISSLHKAMRRQRRLFAGDMLDRGRYTLVRRAGRGDYSEAWCAHDGATGGLVVLKVLHAQHGDDAEICAHFKRTAAALQTIDHPHVGRALGACVEEAGLLFLPLEFYPKGTLAKLVRAGQLTADARLTVLRQLAGALGHLHRAGLVHRDVSPTNVVFDADGQPRLIDFDLCALRTDNLQIRPWTASPYTAPECAKLDGTTGPATDVYGLAATAMFMFLGQDPVDAMHHPGSALDGAHLARHQRHALIRAIRWRPEDRFAGVDEFMAAFSAPRRFAPPLLLPPRRMLALGLLGSLVALALALALARLACA